MRKAPAVVLALAFFATLAAAPEARADCASGAVSVWPTPGEPLDPTGVIVVEGYGHDQEWVLDIARLSPRLESGREQVPLRVVERHQGAFEVAQVVLAPVRPLGTGARYRLALTGRPVPEIWTSRSFEVPAWHVGHPDRAAPLVRSPARLRDTSFVRFGCGPGIHAHVAVDIDDHAHTLVRVRVTPKAGGETVEYVIPAGDGAVSVGHGMCSGPFRLEPGRGYVIRLVEAIDVAGNTTPIAGGPIVVDMPPLAE